MPTYTLNVNGTNHAVTVSDVGQDPYQFRRARLTDPRWIAVLEAAASAHGWGNALPAGSARGIAIGTAFNSIVAQVVEISGVGSSSIRVSRCTVAVDCYLR